MITESDLSAMIADAMTRIDYPTSCKGLYRPVDYTLQAGGKRLRPLLALAVCQALGKDPAIALPQAIAVEMFHNFTLIHDDVMDHSDLRRGRPTVMKRWGEVQAILSGDALLTMATMQAAKCDSAVLPRVLALFNKTALEVYEGQQFDTAFETRSRVSIASYIEMIRLKTSVLLGCACAMGALMAGADDAVQQSFYNFGVNLGLAFQLRDDYLDTYGDPDIFGKPIGGDIVNRKHTWLYITAVNEARPQMEKIYSSTSMSAKRRIKDVTNIYNTLNIGPRCEQLISKYCKAALTTLASTGISAEDRAWFENLVNRLASRVK